MRATGLVVCAMSMLSAITPTHATTNNAGSGAERTLDAYRLSDGEAPVIDGQLDDQVWSRVDVAENFIQIDPNEGAAPSQPTRVWIAYDSQNLYVAWEITETRPGYLTASVRERDGNIGTDDWVRVFLDPFRSGRDSYNFELNAYGSRFDGLVENNLTERGAWNAVWQARTQITPTGWTAEMAIPFRNMSYPSDGSDWGIDFSRVVQREFEVHRWAQHDQIHGLNNLSNIGLLQGIEGIDRGRGLEVEAFAASRYTHVWEIPGQEDDLVFDASMNAYYKITDALTGTLTLNTDFSDTPLDPRIVSTSRFATFFSETRDFFLQDSAIFEFGGRAFTEDSNGRPFFSRRIGFANGRVVDLVGGAKLSGRWAGHDIGALVTQMGPTENFGAQTLATARVSHPFTNDLKLGAIFTMGDPDGSSENLLGGVDLQWARPFDGGQWTADTFFLLSDTDGEVGSGIAFGGWFRYVTDPLFLRLRVKHLEEGYNPQLGFVNRPNSRYYALSGRRRWRPENSFFRNIDLWQWNDFYFDLDNNLESREIGGSFEGSFVSSDNWGIFVADIYERVDDPFTLPGGPVVAADEYRFFRVGGWLSGADNRVISPHFEVNCCAFFGGERLGIGANLQWRPGPVFSMEWNNSLNIITIPSGDTDIYVTGMEGTVSFTPDMQLKTEVQWDNISGNLNVFSRFVWEFSPGSELFIGVGHNADVPARDFANEFSSNVSTVTVRVSRTLNY